jgi:osmoprotectant transport system permease protein
VGPAPGRELTVFHFLRQVIDWFGNGANWTGSQGVPELLLGHVELCLYALLISLAVALPLGLWLGHTGRGGTVAINVTNVGRALPAFAVLVIAAQSPLGIGLKPALAALILLSIPPILTNTYTAIREVDPDARDAAVGMGMSGMQVLRQVEIPSSIPLIFAGIRTAAVQAVATATLGGFVAYNCLGTLINEGLAVNDQVEIFAGSLLVVALALGAEFSLSGLQRIVTPAGLRADGPSPSWWRKDPTPEPLISDAFA